MVFSLSANGGFLMKRAVLYLRVSTVDQTTANQERELRQIAERVGYELSRSTGTTASAAPRGATSALPSTPFAEMPPNGSSMW